MRNTAAGYLSFGVNSLLGFLVTPYLLHHLGVDGFGVWVLVLSIIGYVGLVELGLGAATARQVAAAGAGGADDSVEAILGSSRLLYLGVAAVGVLLMAPVVALLPHLVRIPEASVGPARGALSLLVLAQVITFHFTVYSAALIGKGRFDLLAVPGLVTAVATAGSQAIVVAVTKSLTALAAVTVIAALVSAAVNRWIYVRAVGGSVPRLSAATRSAARSLAQLGRYNALLGLFGTIAYSSDLVVVGIFLPSRSVAAYAVATRAVNVIRILSTRATDVLMPTFADSAAREDYSRSFRLFSDSVLVSLALALPGCVALIVYGPGLLTLWLGTPPPESESVAAYLAAALLLQLPAHSVFTFFSGIGQLRKMVWFSAFAALGNLALSIVLVASVGVHGPAAGTMIEVGLTGALLPILACRAMAVRYRDYARAALAPVAPAALLVLALGLGSRVWLSPGPALSGVLAIAGSVVSLLTVFACLGRDRRRRYARSLSRAT